MNFVPHFRPIKPWKCAWIGCKANRRGDLLRRFCDDHCATYDNWVKEINQ